MSKENDGTTASTDDPTIDADTHWTQAVQRHYDADGENQLTAAIVYAIAEARGVDPVEVKRPRLYECVDVAALDDAFFGSDVGDELRRGTGAVEFRYGEFLVKVRSDGWIQIYESTEPDLS